MIEKLEAISYSLKTISVSGVENMSKLLGSICALDELIADIKTSEKQEATNGEQNNQ